MSSVSNDPSYGIPPLLLSPTKSLNFTDILGIVDLVQLPALTLAKLPALIREVWVSPAEFELFGGAVFGEGVTTETTPSGLDARMSADTHRARGQIRVPTAVSSITTATLYYKTDSTTPNYTITVGARGVADAENYDSGGVSDTATFTPGISNGVRGAVNVLTAFDAAGLIAADETLVLLVSISTYVAGLFQFMGLKLVFATT